MSGMQSYSPAPASMSSFSFPANTNMQSLPRLSTSSRSLRRKSTEIVLSAPGTPPPRRPPSPVMTLSQHGIRVRDFAYESTLPRIAPFRPKPRPPGPRPLKRMRKTYDGADPDDPFLDLGRPITSTFGRGHGFEGDADHKRWKPSVPAVSETTDYPSQSQESQAEMSQPPPFVREGSPSPSSQPPRHLSSQDSEPYVDTPLVTPNGSLQWTVGNTSDIPASQLDRQSQAQPPDLVSYSQLGFLPQELESQVEDEELQRATSPIRPTSPFAQPFTSPQRTPPGPSNISRAPQHASSPGGASPVHSASPPVSSTPRYDLRKRPAAAEASPHSPSPDRTRRRTQPPAKVAKEDSPRKGRGTRRKATAGTKKRGDGM
ncbi:hypothetical protein PLICRDRAFT_33825 [Plicaturopsis crispa FD-325 SS-3]|nr:hypothetical protein PLICRDRAFT_33825 [Plicaturopsis crispa FD-325 SS-3]